MGDFETDIRIALSQKGEPCERYSRVQDVFQTHLGILPLTIGDLPMRHFRHDEDAIDKKHREVEKIDGKDFHELSGLIRALVSRFLELQQSIHARYEDVSTQEVNIVRRRTEQNVTALTGVLRFMDAETNWDQVEIIKKSLLTLQTLVENIREKCFFLSPAINPAYPPTGTEFEEARQSFLQYFREYPAMRGILGFAELDYLTAAMERINTRLREIYRDFFRVESETTHLSGEKRLVKYDCRKRLKSLWNRKILQDVSLRVTCIANEILGIIDEDSNNYWIPGKAGRIMKARKKYLLRPDNNSQLSFDFVALLPST